MQCARHPKVETNLSCGRCGTPICPRCLVHHEVGIRCPKCAPRPRHIFGRNTFASGGGLLVALIVGGIIATQLFGRSGNRGPTLEGGAIEPKVLTRQTAAPATGSQLQLVSAACERVDVANVTACQGVIKNVSGRSLKGVQAIVEWLDDGEIRGTDTARVPEDPLLPGQEGSWGVEATHSNGLEEYRLRFVGSEGSLQAAEP